MRKAIAILFGLMALAASQTASAATIQLALGAGGNANDHILGEVFQPGDLNCPGGLTCRDAAAVNGLLAVPLNTRQGTDPEYWRSSTNFGSLPAASATGAVFAGGVGDMSFV